MRLLEQKSLALGRGEANLPHADQKELTEKVFSLKVNHICSHHAKSGIILSSGA